MGQFMPLPIAPPVVRVRPAHRMTFSGRSSLTLDVRRPEIASCVA